MYWKYCHLQYSFHLLWLPNNEKTFWYLPLGISEVQIQVESYPLPSLHLIFGHPKLTWHCFLTISLVLFFKYTFFFE